MEAEDFFIFVELRALLLACWRHDGVVVRVGMMPDARCPMLDAGCGMLNVGVLDAGCWMLDDGRLKNL